MMTAD